MKVLGNELVLFFLATVGIQIGDASQLCDAVYNNSVISEEIAPGFYKKTERNQITIFAETVTLDGNDRTNYDPCKDLYIEAISVILKGTLLFHARNVKIIAINVTAQGTAATIDNSYVEVGLPDYHTQAASGRGYGESGQNGRNGGDGGAGGTINLSMTQLGGGSLLLKANGGPGGMGEAGGDGHVGRPGEPNSDLTACCHGRSTTGSHGYPGGNAGKPGKSGNGGSGGAVNVNFPSWVDSSSGTARITITVEGGNPGPQAKPGVFGEGGVGGAGSPTHCYNAGSWIDHKKRCKEPLGLNGSPGPAGLPASSASPGSVGKSGSKDVGSDSVYARVSGSMLQMVLRYANDKYKAGQPKEAAWAYLWIIEVTNSSTDKSDLNFKRLSITYLAQLAHGFDFWGYPHNHVSLISYSALYEHLKDDIIPYAAAVEKDVDNYQDKTQTEEKRTSTAQNFIQHEKVLVDSLARKISDARDSLKSIQLDLRHLQKIQELALYRSQGVTETCQSAVQNYIAHKDALTFGDIFKIIFSAVKVVFDGVKLALDFTGEGEAADAATSSFGKKFPGIAGDVEDTISDTETLVKNIKYAVDKHKKYETDEKNAVTLFNQIKSTIDVTGKENSAKLVVEEKSFDNMIHKWLFLPECKDAESDFTAYINASTAVNNKIMEHDAVVIQIVQLEATMQHHQDLAAQMQSTLSQNYNPFTFSFAQSVRAVYTTLKDSIVSELKKLHEAYSYRFLSSKPFTFDDSRVSMIQALLANNRIEMLDKMEIYGRNVQTFNKDLPPLSNTIVLKREELLGAFNDFDSTKQISFALSGSESFFSAWSQIRMTRVKVWLPELRSTSEEVRVWIERLGNSLFFDQEGEPWRFTHSPRQIFFSYDKKTLQETTAISDSDDDDDDDDNDDFASISPLGLWIINVENNLGVDTRRVTRIHLQIEGTFFPCLIPKCPPRRYELFSVTANATSSANSTEAGPTTQAAFQQSSKLSNGALAAIVVVVALIIFIVIAVPATVFLKRKNNKERDIKERDDKERKQLIGKK